MNAHRLAAPPATHRPRFGRSLLALCAFFALLCPSLVWSASCSYTNFSIGFEYSAQVGPDAQGRYLFAASPLRCDGSGNVIFDPGTGFSDGYEIGWYSQSEIRSALKNAGLFNFKAFEGWCRLHYIGMNTRYHGTVAGVNADAYVVKPTPYINVFTQPLHLQLGQQPYTWRRDAVAEQSLTTYQSVVS